MKKALVVSVFSLFLFSSCGTYTATGTYTGGTFGSSIGSAIGGIAGGPRGSDIGTLIGMASGAAVGAAVGSAVDNAQQQRYEDMYYNNGRRVRSSNVNRYRYWSESANITIISGCVSGKPLSGWACC